MRTAGGILAAGIGAFMLSYGACGRAAFFLVVGAADLALGCGEITSVRRRGAEPEPAHGDIPRLTPKRLVGIGLARPAASAFRRQATARAMEHN
jgi:hypothetical protein